MIDKLKESPPYELPAAVSRGKKRGEGVGVGGEEEKEEEEKKKRESYHDICYYLLWNNMIFM